MTAIAESLGYPSTSALYRGSELHIEGPTQEELNEAVLAYAATHDATYLAKIKDACKLDLDHAAENARLRHVTPGAAQSQVYAEKAEEATDYIAAGYPEDLGNFPYIQIEADATKKTGQEVADGIVEAKSRWIKTSTKIERIRLAAKQKISKARKPESVEKTLEQAVEKLNKI